MHRLEQAFATFEEQDGLPQLLINQRVAAMVLGCRHFGLMNRMNLGERFDELQPQCAQTQHHRFHDRIGS